MQFNGISENATSAESLTWWEVTLLHTQSHDLSDTGNTMTYSTWGKSVTLVECRILAQLAQWMKMKWIQVKPMQLENCRHVARYISKQQWRNAREMPRSKLNLLTV